MDQQNTEPKDWKTIILSQNQKAMDSLRQNEFKLALQTLKEAENCINAEVGEPSLRSLLLGVTYNNFGWYYKQREKYSVALQFLQNAVQAEEQSEDKLSRAGTYINLCSVFSLLKKHKEALEAAKLALNLLTGLRNLPNLKPTQIIAIYNVGTELEYLRQYRPALEILRRGYNKGVKHFGPGHQLVNKIKQSIQVNTNKLALQQRLTKTRRKARTRHPIQNHIVQRSFIASTPISPTAKEVRSTSQAGVKLPEIRNVKRSTSDLRTSRDRSWNKIKLDGLRSSERDKLKPYLLRL